jgi:hypothetical protein
MKETYLLLCIHLFLIAPHRLLPPRSHAPLGLGASGAAEQNAVGQEDKSNTDQSKAMNF